ncbi:chromosome segregation protein SMC [Candidatus Woesearchaeota archaeon]|nr:chromosome segregation protein SMC [Candidatus Woesearchaeota archaeon]
MTRINRLVLHGFKSFAKYTDLEFGSRFNCVLGPNGSGKSNILDALCFVLGKTSSKSLRAEKSANLIYNGGKAKKPSKRGEVSIFFDNKQKTFPTEETEVKVTRIIKDNGQSIYKINDQTRTRQQIVDLMGIAKIDPDGYNIILQGDIVRFCEMSANDRRLLIEEISGISVYEEKKHKAIGQLSKVEERLKEAEIILSERKTYLKELKKDRDQALKFKDMTENIRKYKASLIKLNMDKKEKDLNEVKERMGKHSSSIEGSLKKVETFKQDIVNLKAEIEKITKEIEQKGETDQVNLNREIEELKIEMTKKGSRVDTLASEIIKLDQREKDLEKGLNEIKEKIASLEKDKEKFDSSRKEKGKQQEELKEKVAQFKEKHNIEVAGEIEKRIDEIDEQSEELAKDINVQREKQHHFFREKDKVEHELGTIKAAIDKVSEIEKEHKKQLDDLKKKREEFKQTTLELNKLLDEDSNLGAKVRDARERVEQAHEKLAKLRSKQTTIKEFSLGDNAVKAVLNNKEQGVYGTVADLGKVSAKFSLALEVAAGSRMKSVVVENDKIAADQINYLRKNRLGVATFLPLNKIKAKKSSDNLKKLKDADGVHGLAAELVSYDAKFKDIFSYVFGDVLVVDTLDVARRLGIGKARYVSLDGDLADISGRMVGGYRDKKRKGMGFSVAEVDKEIEDHERTVASNENNLSSFQSRRADIDEKITGLRTKKGELEGDIIKNEKALHLEGGDLALSRKKEEDLEQQNKQLEDDINKIQDTIAEKNKGLASIKTEKQKLRSEISQLRSPTLLAELSTYEEKIRELSQEIATLNGEIKNIDIQHKDIFQPEIEKTNTIVKQIEKDRKQFVLEMEDLRTKLNKEDKILKEREKEAKEFYTKFKELFSKRSVVNDDITKKEHEISRIQEKSREVEIKNNTLSIKNAELSAEMSGLKEEFSQYEGVALDMEKNDEQLKYQISRFEKMKEQIGTVNMRALEIYEEIEKEYNRLTTKKDTLAQEKADVEELMNEIEGKKKDLFMKTYDSINKEFQKIFSSLSKKGEASLELENKEDPFAEGVRIKVKITGQRFLDIRSLSGGEKTMTALAFIFAIQEHDPASFYILDEVDAALDKHNSEKLSKLIQEYCEHAQYILITHNDGIISEADTLYGVSMDEHGMSKVVSLKI